MSDPFEKKVRAEAVAGWWVILIGYALLTLTWVVYLALVSARPAWMLAAWGQGANWDLLVVVCGNQRLDVRLRYLSWSRLAAAKSFLVL
jgi:hypothetical protein